MRSELSKLTKMYICLPLILSSGTAALPATTLHGVTHHRTSPSIYQTNAYVSYTVMTAGHFKSQCEQNVKFLYEHHMSKLVYSAQKNSSEYRKECFYHHVVLLVQ